MKHIVPFGDRILVIRDKVGEKVAKDSLIELPDSVKERDTDLATVIDTPDNTFADNSLIEKAENTDHSLLAVLSQNLHQHSTLHWRDLRRLHVLPFCRRWSNRLSDQARLPHPR